MERRRFIALGAALAASPALLEAQAPGHVTFSNTVYEEALASGEPLLLNFYASW